MIEQIRPLQVNEWLAAQKAPPVVLDVREDWEVEAASVKPEGFALQVIPMSELQERVGELSPDSAIAVLCHHGHRSQRVALFLEQQGFSKLANIAGGIEAWAEERDPGVPRY
jgi:rhodanese-related sulfurtransferase